MSQFYLTWTTTLFLTKKLRFSVKCEILSTSVPFVKKKRLSSTFISMTIVFASLLLYLSIVFFVHYFFWVWSGLFFLLVVFFLLQKRQAQKRGQKCASSIHHLLSVRLTKGEILISFLLNLWIYCFFSFFSIILHVKKFNHWTNNDQSWCSGVLQRRTEVFHGYFHINKMYKRQLIVIYRL